MSRLYLLSQVRKFKRKWIKNRKVFRGADARIGPLFFGLLAQLGEHSVCTREVKGSTPLRSTICFCGATGRRNWLKSRKL